MTNWRSIGLPWLTADMSAAIPTVFQRVRLGTALSAQVLQGLNTDVIVHNPTMTALVAEIWSDKGGSPGRLLAQSSTSYTRAQLLTGVDNYGLKELGFRFTPLALVPGNFYCIALRASGYTYGLNTHLAWRNGYPDPVYKTGVTLTAANASKHPFNLSLVTSPL